MTVKARGRCASMVPRAGLGGCSTMSCLDSCRNARFLKLPLELGAGKKNSPALIKVCVPGMDQAMSVSARFAQWDSEINALAAYAETESDEQQP